MLDRTADGRPLKILTLIDEFTKEALAIYVARRIRAHDVIDLLAEVMIERGIPEHIRSDNGPEMVAKSLRAWLGRVGTKTLHIQPGSPWENGYCESFNGKLRNELLNGEFFYTLREAQVLIEQWRGHYHRVRPHSALDYRPPAPEASGLAPSPRIISITRKRAASTHFNTGPIKAGGTRFRVLDCSVTNFGRRCNVFREKLSLSITALLYGLSIRCSNSSNPRRKVTW